MLTATNLDRVCIGLVVGWDKNTKFILAGDLIVRSRDLALTAGETLGPRAMALMGGAVLTRLERNGYITVEKDSSTYGSGTRDQYYQLTRQGRLYIRETRDKISDLKSLHRGSMSKAQEYRVYLAAARCLLKGKLKKLPTRAVVDQENRHLRYELEASHKRERKMAKKFRRFQKVHKNCSKFRFSRALVKPSYSITASNEDTEMDVTIGDGDGSSVTTEPMTPPPRATTPVREPSVATLPTTPVRLARTASFQVNGLHTPGPDDSDVDEMDVNPFQLAPLTSKPSLTLQTPGIQRSNTLDDPQAYPSPTSNPRPIIASSSRSRAESQDTPTRPVRVGSNAQLHSVDPPNNFGGGLLNRFWGSISQALGIQTPSRAAEHETVSEQSLVELQELIEDEIQALQRARLECEGERNQLVVQRDALDAQNAEFRDAIASKDELISRRNAGIRLAERKAEVMVLVLQNLDQKRESERTAFNAENERKEQYIREISDECEHYRGIAERVAALASTPFRR